MNAKSEAPVLTLVRHAQKGQPSRYHYPASLLKQAFFCRLGNGSWTSPPLDLSMLVNPKFVSPLGALLEQLEADGHDVVGARIEWRAFRELAGQLEADLRALANQATKLRRDTPVCAAALYENREP